MKVTVVLFLNNVNKKKLKIRVKEFIFEFIFHMKNSLFHSFSQKIIIFKNSINFYSIESIDSSHFNSIYYFMINTH